MLDRPDLSRGGGIGGEEEHVARSPLSMLLRVSLILIIAEMKSDLCFDLIARTRARARTPRKLLRIGPEGLIDAGVPKKKNKNDINHRS